MSKLYIMKGLPASGKTTKSAEIIKQTGNTVRLNKDLMRKMLHMDKFTGYNESLTREAVRSLALMFLKKKMNVIIDDTNLNPGTFQSWKDLAKDIATVEVVDLTHIPVVECVFRDSKRDDSVGGTVIKNMALRSQLTNFAPDSVVLCDIDGTIADINHRLHYVKNFDNTKDWKSFFAEMDKDSVREDVRKMLIQFYNEGKTVIFMSARPEDYKEVTLKWLDDNMLSFAYTLIMRKSGDKRPDTEVKKDMLEQHFPDVGVIHTILDDRPSVIRLWKELKLPVIDVGAGEEF